MNQRVRIFFILCALNVCAVSLKSQNVDYADSFQNYDFSKSLKLSAKDLHVQEKLKSISEWVESFSNVFRDYFSNSIIAAMFDMLSQNASTKCHRDLQYALRNLFPPAEWALKMVDSFGKPDSGILLGNVKWIGEYDECLSAYAPPKGIAGVGDFHGKYCTLQIPIKLKNKSYPLSTALCLPDSCNPDDITHAFSNIVTENSRLAAFYEEMEYAFSTLTITCKSTSKDLTAGAFFVICFLFVVALLAAVGTSFTVLECYLKAKEGKELSSLSYADEKVLHNGDVENALYEDTLRLGAKADLRLPAWMEKCKPFFNCFCIVTNGKKILNTDNGENHLSCIHGIRFLSMTWVIVCHFFLIGARTVRNPLEFIYELDTWMFQIIVNGFFSVDSFFVLSGFLVGYVYFQQAAKTDGKIPLLYFYIHRYVRLTPAYMVVLAFFTTIYPFLVVGPLSPDHATFRACEENWWWNLLYINNFQSLGDQCVIWSWYLANDMQFYIFSPVFLITLWRWPKIGYSLFALLFCITSAANFFLTYQYNLLPGVGNVVEYAKDLETYVPKSAAVFNFIYIKPYSRVGAYLVGILLAYYLHKRKQHDCAKLNRITLWIGWIVAATMTLACQFGLYHQHLSRVAASFYNAFSHIGFSLGLSWVIFVCVLGQGDVVNSILSWKAWIPLSRLSYCAFLVHPIVLSIYFLSTRTLIEYSYINTIILHLGTLTFSYAAALVISLLFESPIIRLEKLLRKKCAGKDN